MKEKFSILENYTFKKINFDFLFRIFQSFAKIAQKNISANKKG